MAYYFFTLVLALSACGEFVNDEQPNTPRSRRREIAIEAKQEAAQNNDAQAAKTKKITIVGIEDADIEDVKSCITNFKSFPFPARIENYSKISAKENEQKVIVFDDQEESPILRLVLIDSNTLNLPSIVYNLFGKNTYYCLRHSKVKHNSVSINLGCKNQYTWSQLQKTDIDYSKSAKIKNTNKDGSACP